MNFQIFHSECNSYNNSSNDSQLLLSSQDSQFTMGSVCSEIRPHGLDPGSPFIRCVKKQARVGVSCVLSQYLSGLDTQRV